MNQQTREQLIRFAREQMARQGEIDSLIFTTRNLSESLKATSENLNEAIEDVRRVLNTIPGGDEDASSAAI
jgi:hypothetical protein